MKKKIYKPNHGIEAAEPRLLFSAGLEGVLATHDLGIPSAGVEQAAIEQSIDRPTADASTTPAVETGLELIFVDTDTPEYQTLLSDLLTYPDDTTTYQVFELDNTRDGIAQITAILGDFENVSAIHILSHGTEGAIDLGGSTLDSDALAANAYLVSSWGNAFTEDGDILIYGCDLAATSEGQLLVNSIATLTGADVAASDDLTGSAELGGDWDLEYQTGTIETRVSVAQNTHLQWTGLLDITTGLVGHWTLDSDGSDSSGNSLDGSLGGNANIDTSVPTNMVGPGKVALDGSNDYVDLSTHAATLGTLSQGTIAGWINTSDTTNTQTLFGIADHGDAFSFATFGIYQGNLFFDMAENASYSLSVQTDATISDGNWHHVAITVDGTGNSFYIDGSKVLTADLNYLTGNASSTNFLDNVLNVDAVQIGVTGESGGYVYDFNGLIDEVRVYDRALSAGDITELATFGINNAPVLSGTNDLTDIYENPVSNDGTLISDLISGQFTDADAGALSGIAVVGVDNTNGTWQYSTFGGAFWLDFGAPGTSAARLLAADADTTYVRFVPDADWNGTISNGLTFHAWDQTSGSSGGVADLTIGTGGTTAFSAATASSSITVLPPANDAPIFSAGASNGSVSTAIGSGADVGYRVITQPDGKILFAGYSNNGTDTDFALVRYNPDGTLDTSFSGDGKVTTDFGIGNDAAVDMALQADGKILLAGSSWNGSNNDFAVVRYNADGTLDTSFSGDGKLTTDIAAGNDTGQSMVLQADGKILVTGNSSVSGNLDIALVRYNADGTLDTTFSGDGKLTVAVGAGFDYGKSVTVQADGKILVAGYSAWPSSTDFSLLRFNSDGTLDTSFSGDGMVSTDFGGFFDGGQSVAVQADGKILVTGYAADADPTVSYIAVARYNADGTLDTTFSGDGKVTTAVGTGQDVAYSTVVQSDGKIVVAGKSQYGVNNSENEFAVVRYNTDGTLDTSFNGDGMLTTNVGDTGWATSLSLQPDDKLLVAGYSFNGTNNVFTMARYSSDGTLETNFGAPTYTEDGPAMVLDANVQIFDEELTPLDDFSGASLTLVRNGGASAEDIFSATGNLAALTESGSLVLSGVTIGTVTTNSGGTLVLSFNANATQARVNETLQSIAYANSSDAPPASTQINWDFNDGNSGAQGTGGALSATGSTTVTITAVNDAPVVNPTASDTGTEDTDVVYTHAQLLTLIGATDVDDANANLSIAISNINNGTLVMSGGSGGAGTTFTFTPTLNFVGNLTFDYQVSDDESPTTGNSAVGTATVALSAVNDTPVVNATASDSGTEDTDVVYTHAQLLTLIGATDVDDANANLSIAISNINNGTLVMSGGSGGAGTTFTFTPTLNFVGNLTFDYQVSDDESPTPASSAVGTATVALSAVNDAPVAVDDTYNVNEGGGGFLPAPGVMLNDSDVDSGSLTAIQLTNVTYGTLTLNPNGSWWYTRDPDYNGTDSFTYKINDGMLDSNVATVTINIAPVNDAPVVNATASDTGTEDTDVVYTHAQLLTLIGATDVDDVDANLGIAITNVNNGTLVMSGGTGGAGTTFTFTPTLNFVGNLSFDYQVSDDESPTPANSAVGTATVALSAVNDAPVFLGLDNTPTYIEGGAAVQLDADVTVSDIERDALNGGNGDYTASVLNLQRNGGANTDDVFTIPSGGNLTVSGGNIFVGGNLMAGFSNTGGQLSLIFANTGTVPTTALVNEVLQAITYSNSNISNPPASVQIDYSLNDANSGTQGSGGSGDANGSINVTITPVNDAPTDISLSNSSINENTDTSSGYTVGALTSTDPDTGDSHSYAVVGGADMGVFSIGGAGSDELILTDGVLDFETRTSYEVIVRSTDNGSPNLFRDETLTITVNNETGNISGTIYTDEGVTSIGAGANISMVINGVLTETVITDGTGSYSFNKEAAAGDAVAIFIDNDATYQGITVTVADGTDLSGIQVYANHIVVRNDNGGVVTIADMDNALGAYADPDIHYAVVGGNLVANALGSELIVPAGHTFTPGGDVNVTSIKILGTVVGGSNTFNIAENWDSSAGSWFAGTSSVNMIGTGTLNSAGGAFYDLTTGAASQTTTLTSNLQVGNVLTIADSTGTLTDNAAGYDITVTGGGTPFVNNGATVIANKFIYSNGNPVTVTVAGGTYTVAESLQFDGRNTGMGTTFQLNGDLLVNGAGAIQVFPIGSGLAILDTTVSSHNITASSLQVGNSLFQAGFLYAHNSTIDINGDVSFIWSANTTIHLGGSDWSVAGNWANTSGSFTAGTSTVNFDGASQQISGSTAFYNLTKVESTDDGIDSTLTFDNAATQTINGTLTLTGLDADDRINLVSDVPGSQWGINLTAPAVHVLDYIVVTDSDASGSDPGQLTINPANSFSGGNNIGWFGATAGDDSYSVDEGSTTNLDLSANDSDVDGLDLASIVITSGPVNGSIIVNANGTVDYTHDGSETASDSFTYTINDIFGEVSNTGAVTINVNPVNDTPVGVPTITGTATEDQVLTADTSGISDAEGLGTFSYQWLRNGGVIGGATSSTYTLGDADVGTQISVRVDYIDGNSTAESVTSAQTAAVANINDAPAGTNKTVTTLEDTDYTFSATDFGFTDTADSPANALLAVKITTLPVGGALYVDANGDGIVDAGEAVSAADTVALADITANLLKFKPTADANGTGYASFTFQVQDDGGIANGGVDLDASPNTITIDVTAQPDAPVAADDTYVVDQGGVLTLPADHAFLNTWGTTGTADGQFDNPTGVAIDSSGNVYIVDSLNDRIQKFDSTGAFLNSWGSSGSADGEFSNPSRIEVDSAGNMYVTDTGNNRVQVFDSSGNHLLSFGSTGAADGQFSGPRGIVVDSTGNIYVSDQGYHRIQKFDSLGAHIYSFGGQGPADGQFFVQDGLAIDGADNLYVADMLHHRIQVFDSASNHLLSFGSYGSGDGQFSWPQSVAVDTSGNIYVTDQYNHRIQKFDSAGNHVETWGTAGSGNGQFIAPNGIAVNASGNIYVVGGSNDRVQVFSEAGVLVNDFDVDIEPITVYDEDGATPGIQVVSGPGYGILSMNADGSFTYTHDGSPVATDFFTYRITDGALQSAIATVQINVNITDYAATTDNVSASGSEDAASIAITLTGSDIEGTVDYYQLSSLPANGTLYTDAGLTTLAATATDYAATAETLTMYFVPTADWNGVTTFQFSAKDNSGFLDATPGTATLTVNAVNDAPTATNLDAPETYTEDTSLNLIDIVAGDIDSATVTVTLTLSNAAAGSLSTATSGAVTSNFAGGVWSASGAIADVNALLAGATFTPALDYNSNFTIATSVDDGVAAPVTGLKNITGTPVNDTPTLTFPGTVQNTNEDTALVFSPGNGNQIAVGDVDANGGDMLINFLSYNGTLTLNGTAGLTFTTGDGVADTAMTFTGNIAAINAALDGLYFMPDVNFSGGTNFQMWVNDQGNTGAGIPQQTTAAALISVTGVNDVPVATASTVTTTEDNAHTFSVGDFSYTDVEGDALSSVTISNLNLAGGTLEHSGGTTVTNGMTITAAQIASLVYTPAGNTNGAPLATFDFTVNDAGAGVAAAQMDIDVTPVNDTPIANSDIILTGEDSGQTASAPGIMANDTDVEGTAGLYVYAVNGVQANVGSTITLASGARLTVNADGSTSYNTNGAFEYLASGAFANDSFSYTISDAGGLTSTTTVTVFITGVNDAPVTDNVSATGNEDAPSIAITLTGSDVDGTVDNFRLNNLPADGTLYTDAGLTTVAATGVDYAATAEALTLYFVPNADWNGGAGFQYVALDNSGVLDTTPATASITVNAVNDAPVVNATASDTGTEDTDQVYTHAQLLALIGATDVDDVNANLTISITNVANGTLALSGGTGGAGTTFTFTPTANFNGNLTFDYQVSDDESPTPASSAVGTTTVALAPVNDAPVAVDDSYATNEDGGGFLPPFWGVLVNDTDVDGDTLTAILVTPPANGTFTLNPNGSYWWWPDPDYNGITTFTYKVNDGTTDSNTATVTLTVNPVNDEPVTDNVSATGNEDAASIAVTLTGSDIDSTVDFFRLNNLPTDGTLYTDAGLTTVAATGVDYAATAEALTLYFVPNTDWNGITTFQFAAKDDSGLLDATPATATITVNAVNDAPVVNATASDTGTEDTDQVYTHAQLLTLIGATDVDDANANLSIAITNINNGTLVMSGGTGGSGTTFTFTPTANFDGNLTFDYQVSDDDSPTPASSAIGTATVALTPVNDAPVVNAAASDTGTEDTDVVYTHAQLLTLIGATDVDDVAANLSIAISNVNNGTLVISGGTGGVGTTFTFTPTLNFVGNLTFDYQVSDDESPTPATSAVGTATVALSAVNDAPVVNAAASDTGTEDTDVVYTHAQLLTLIGAMDVDDANANLSIAISNVNNGTLVMSGGTGGVGTTFTFTPTLNFVGNLTFDYQVSDDDVPTPASSAVGTATVALAPVNDAPAGVPVITGLVQEDQVLTADTGGISDADGLGAFSYQWLRDGAMISGATSGTYTLGDVDVGALISVRVTYIDGYGTSEGPLVSAQTGPVLNVNDAPLGVPTITGLVQEDQVLTADTGGISDVDGLGTFSYQWLRDGAVVTGATGSTYILDDADVGTLISVQVSYTDGYGTNEGPLVSAQIGPVVNVNDVPVGAVLVDNTTPVEGDTLTASNTLTDADGLSGPISYQWLRDGVAIAGATGNTYTMVSADVGTVISVVASYTDDQGTSESVSSNPTSMVEVILNEDDEPVDTTGNPPAGGADPVPVPVSPVIAPVVGEQVLTAASLDMKGDSDATEDTIYKVKPYEFEDYDYRDDSVSNDIIRPVKMMIDMGTEIAMNLSQLIDLVRMQLSESDEQPVNIFVKSVGGITLAISSTVATWFMRGGVIAASMVSSVPVLKGFDPLIMMKKTKDADEEEDATDNIDDSVDQMFEGTSMKQDLNAGDQQGKS